MINSHLLYRLSYRGTARRMLLIKREVKPLPMTSHFPYRTWTMALVMVSRFDLFSAATQIRPVLTA